MAENSAVYGEPAKGEPAESLIQEKSKQQNQLEQKPFFRSRLPSDESGKPDVTPLCGCQTRELLPPAVTWPENKQRTSTASELQISSTSTLLQGDVVIRDGRSKITADKVTIDKQSQSIRGSGGVSIETREALFRAKELFQDQKSGDTQLTDAWFYMFAKHANGQAKTATVNFQKQTELNQVSFTTCPLEDESWSFNMSKMKLNAVSGWGEAWDTTLKIADVPVFYFPYINFPIDDRRKSGLLSPTLRSDDINGADYTQPIYWNIAPQTDMTFFPRIIQNRGFQLGNEWRLRSQSSYLESYLEWLPEDRLAAQQLQQMGNDPLLQSSGLDEQRWYARLAQDTAFNQHWNLQVDARRVSDKTYFIDLASGLENSSQTQLATRANLNYLDKIWQIELSALTHQSLVETQSYRYLPNLRIEADHLSEANLRWQLDAQWSRLQNKDVQRIEGDRAHIVPSLSYSLRRAWGHVIPKISYLHSEYQQSNQLTGETQTLTRSLPAASLDATVHFQREFGWFTQDYTHELSPRLFYNYIPQRDQQAINNFDTNLSSFQFEQLWRENRFSGIDRIGDANHVSLALSNSLINNKNGEQVFNFSFGRKYYLRQSEVTLNQQSSPLDTENSPWLVELETRLSDSLRVGGFLQWQHATEKTDQANSYIKYEPKANYIVNLSHRYRSLINQQTEEIDFSFALPINQRWRLLGRWYRNLDSRQTIDSLLGVEYESCCWAIRLVGEKHLNSPSATTDTTNPEDARFNTGIELQFIFKGVGSLGQTGLTNKLETGISGYVDPFQR